MEKTFLFYDIETTGLNPCFDQVLQFAAIRTDLELNELARHEINIKLNCDIIPSPAAMITHGIGLDHHQDGVDEYNGILKIFKLLNTPGTISLGYNTLGFDDEFLRFSFYRNLLPPYSHQYANGCSRMDLYPITVMFYLFQDDALEIWPQQNQLPSLKLERLSEANGLSQGRAHNAMVDVCATLALARKFYQKRPMWDYLMGYFDRNTDLSRSLHLSTAFTVEQLPFKEALIVDGKIGAKCNYLAPVLSLGQHDHYKNQHLWLRLDCENFDEPWVIRKKIAENQLLLPIKARFLDKLNLDRQQLANHNKDWLLKNPDRLTALMKFYRQYTYPKIPEVDADAALYDIGFPDPHEEKLMQKFHQTSVSEKMRVAETFPNNIRKNLALRIMGRHFFSNLSPEYQKLFREYQSRAFFKDSVDYRGQSKLILEKALDEARMIKNTQLLPHQQTLLDQYIQFFSLKDLKRVENFN